MASDEAAAAQQGITILVLYGSIKLSKALRCLDHTVVRKRRIESTGVQRVSLLKKDDRH